MTDIQIPSLTVTCLMVTAAVCIVTVFVAWYTVRDRVKFSQMILGAFCYVLVMLLEGLSGLLPAPAGGPPLALYAALTVVAARELVRFPAMRYGVRGRFQGADAAIGFALGFGGLYLLVCGAYYFNLYTVAREFMHQGLDEFLAASGADAGEALELVKTIAGQSGLQFLATALNRVFYLVRETALCLLLWYAMEEKKTYWYALGPLLHLLAMLPEGLYQAELLASSYARDGAACVISAGIAFLAARQYNAHENQAAHYQVERLRARRRR